MSDDSEIRTWLNFELTGYYDSPEARKYMDLMWRWIEKDKNTGYWMPFAAVNATITEYQNQIKQLQVPNVQVARVVPSYGGGAYAGFSDPVVTVLTRLNNLTSEIISLVSIRSRVLAHVHNFISGVYYSLVFSGAAESIFQSHQIAIDNLLREKVPDVLEKIPSISDRLAAGDKEAVSQAMSSCRRMVEAFADSVHPPSESPDTVKGHKVQVTKDKILNRIYVFLHKTCASETRRKRLNQGLHRIYERASAGTHHDVTPGEARALFLNTYLTLGEILEASKTNQDEGSAKDKEGSDLTVTL
jgi:hypothetical protein